MIATIDFVENNLLSKKHGGSFAGTVDMKGNEILGVSNIPYDSSSAISKKYADEHCLSQGIDLDMNGKRVSNCVVSGQDDAINMKYVASFFLHNKKSINMKNKRIENLGEGTNSDELIHKKYISDKFRKKAHELDALSTNLINLGDPQDNNDLVNKKYADKTFYSTNGGTIDAAGHRIVNVSLAVADADLVSKKYVNANHYDINEDVNMNGNKLINIKNGVLSQSLVTQKFCDATFTGDTLVLDANAQTFTPPNTSSNVATKKYVDDNKYLFASGFSGGGQSVINVPAGSSDNEPQILFSAIQKMGDNINVLDEFIHLFHWQKGCNCIISLPLDSQKVSEKVEAGIKNYTIVSNAKDCSAAQDFTIPIDVGEVVDTIIHKKRFKYLLHNGKSHIWAQTSLIQKQFNIFIVFEITTNTTDTITLFSSKHCVIDMDLVADDTTYGIIYLRKTALGSMTVNPKNMMKTSSFTLPPPRLATNRWYVISCHWYEGGGNVSSLWCNGCLLSTFAVVTPSDEMGFSLLYCKDNTTSISRHVAFFSLINGYVLKHNDIQNMHYLLAKRYGVVQ